MNILIISSMYPPVNKANLSAENMALHYMARQWAKLGHNVVAFPLIFHKTPMTDIVKRNFSKKIFETKAENVSIYIKDFKMNSANTTVRRSALKKAAKQYLKILKNLPEPDMLIVHSPASSNDLVEMLKLKCKKVAVFDVADCNALSDKSFNLKKLESEYDVYGFTLKFVKAKIENVLPITKPSFLGYTNSPNFVVPDEFKERKWDNSFFKLLFVGELMPKKNLDIAINALALLTDRSKFHLSIIGIGSMEPALRHIVINNHLEKNVTFYGSLPRYEIFNAMRDSDIFLMTCSPASFGLVYLEAMSQGCIPITVYDEMFDGVIENDVNGYIIQEKDEQALAKCLEELAKTSNKRLKTVSDKAVESVKGLSEENLAKRYICELTELIKESEKSS